MHTRSKDQQLSRRGARSRLLAMLVVLLLAAACGGDEPTSAEGEPEEPVRCPLTGVETDDDFPVDRPALAVKIDNAPPARPQAGLENADIVFEELGEGGLTRLLSFYHCDDAADLGPVRSARNVDPDIMREFAPVLFGYSGANQQVLAKLAQTEGVTDLVHGSHGDAYRRVPDRNAPYNLFSSTEALRDLEDAQGVEGGPPGVGFVFDPELLETGAQPSPTGTASPSPGAAEAAESVSFQFSPATRIRYSYDPDRQVYLRFHGDEPHTSASGEQLSAVNVVVMKVQISTGTVRDASGALTQETDVVGSGEVVVLHGGMVEFGTWNRPSLSSNTTLEDRDGGTLELAPGNTWIHMIGQGEAVNVSS